MDKKNLKESLNSTKIQPPQEDPSQDSMFCSENNQAVYLCLNERCKMSPIFICSLQSCECQEKHQFCPRGHLGKALDKIRSKLKKPDELRSHIEKTFDQIIDQLNSFKEDLLKVVDEEMEFIMLHKVEEKLLKVSQKELDSTSIDTSDTSFIWQAFCGKIKNVSDIFDEFTKKANLFQQSIHEFALKTKTQILEEVNTFKRTRQYELNRIQPNALLRGYKHLNSQTVQRLIKMFPKKVKSIQLLFKASKNNFSLQRYYDAFGHETDTIILALSNKNKLFGGYTPFCFWTGEQGWVPDQKKQSFLFSISENQKFKLYNQKHSIYRRATKNLGIFFGTDFIIQPFADEAKAQSCFFGEQSSYKNQNYKKDKRSFLKLNGNETKECSLKEWEVYKVELKQ